MITREFDGALGCVRQTDHAAAAGRLAEAWGNDEIPPLQPRDPVIRAIAHHDDGWSGFDDPPRFDPSAGAPHTYRNQPIDDQLEIAKRSVERVAALHPYAGWLVSRHFASFHAGRGDPGRTRWVVEQIGTRARLLAEARPEVGRDALHPHVLEGNFDRLQLLDAVSLALCHDWDGWESRPMAIGYGEEVRTWRYARIDPEPRREPAVEGRLEPWPFGPDRLEVEFPVRILAGTRWKDPEELGSAWKSGRRATLEAGLARG